MILVWPEEREDILYPLNEQINHLILIYVSHDSGSLEQALKYTDDLNNPITQGALAAGTVIRLQTFKREVEEFEGGVSKKREVFRIRYQVKSIDETLDWLCRMTYNELETLETIKGKLGVVGNKDIDKRLTSEDKKIRKGARLFHLYLREYGDKG